jgi:hypothetical protein
MKVTGSINVTVFGVVTQCSLVKKCTYRSEEPAVSIIAVGV